jgi:hypothetical protein
VLKEILRKRRFKESLTFAEYDYLYKKCPLSMRPTTESVGDSGIIRERLTAQYEEIIDDLYQKFVSEKGSDAL